MAAGCRLGAHGRSGQGTALRSTTPHHRRAGEGTRSPTARSARSGGPPKGFEPPAAMRWGEVALASLDHPTPPQSWRRDSNPQPPVYKTGALPIAPLQRPPTAYELTTSAPARATPRCYLDCGHVPGGHPRRGGSQGGSRTAALTTAALPTWLPSRLRRGSPADDGRRGSPADHDEARAPLSARASSSAARCGYQRYDVCDTASCSVCGDTEPPSAAEARAFAAASASFALATSDSLSSIGCVK